MNDWMVDNEDEYALGFIESDSDIHKEYCEYLKEMYFDRFKPDYFDYHKED